MPKNKKTSKGPRRSAFHISPAEAARQDAILFEESLKKNPIQAYQPKKEKVVKKPRTLTERLKDMGVTDPRKGAVRDQLIALGVKQVEIEKIPQDVDAYRRLLLKTLKAEAKAKAEA